jgi:acryloyl-coenzyme A reductase
VKAVLLREFRQRLEFGEAAEPGKLGPTDVLMRVHAAGVCHKDVLIVEGFQPRVGLPRILGHEAAGRVEAIGSDVAEFRVGDRVCSLGYLSCGDCPSCRIGSEHLCRRRQWLGEELDGAYAEFLRSKADALVKIPECVTDEAAAVATCALSTVVHGLNRLARLQAGETVLVTGAAGAVGSNALMVARSMGAKTIGTDVAEKVDQISGADEVLSYGDDLSNRVKRLTSGEGVDIVVEAVGTPTFEQGSRSLRWGGRMVVIGNVRPSESAALALGSIILREITILGSMNATRVDLVEALRLLSEGGLVPKTPVVLPLTEAQHAHDLLRQKRSVGKIILKP